MTKLLSTRCDHPEDQLQPLEYDGRPPRAEEWECAACGEVNVVEVTSRDNCPRCLAGDPGRHPDSGGTHLGPTRKVLFNHGMLGALSASRTIAALDAANAAETQQIKYDYWNSGDERAFRAHMDGSLGIDVIAHAANVLLGIAQDSGANLQLFEVAPVKGPLEWLASMDVLWELDHSSQSYRYFPAPRPQPLMFGLPIALVPVPYKGPMPMGLLILKERR